MTVENFVSTINALFPEPHASLLAGMLFGVRRSMPQDFYEDLLATGTVHVIALSGMNISIIIRVLFETVGALMGRVGAGIATLAAILGFVYLVGPSPTIVRASIMGSLTVISVVVGRSDIPMLSLFFAAGAMILVDAAIITDISFQLSFAATLGILIFAGHSAGTARSLGLRRVLHIVGDDLRITLSAQVFTVPLILYYFQRVSIVSPLANVAVGWLVAPITILGLLLVAVGSVWLPLGFLMTFLVWPLLEVFIIIVELLGSVPYSSIQM